MRSFRTLGCAGLVIGLFLTLPAFVAGQRPAEKPAYLLIYMPADARLEIEGTPTKQTGEVRRFVSPPLPVGKSFTYTLKVIHSDSGRGVVRMGTTQVRGGEETTLDLRAGKDELTSQIIYVPTPQEVVDKMLEMAQVTKDDIVYDLGCGDGRIVVTAAKKFGARGVGVDIDPERIKEGLTNVKDAQVEKLVEIRQGDALKVDDISRATVVMLYMLPEFQTKLQPILEKHLKPGTRVVAHDYPLPDWKPLKVEDMESSYSQHTLYLFKVGETKKD
jgi:uncharacterized protein (TIGR03000 family)